MLALLPDLNSTEERELFADLNYLNLGEMRSFCKEHSIPSAIYIETEAGERKRTKDTDRKSVVLGRVRHFLQTGRVLAPTCFPASTVRLGGPPKVLGPADRLYYGWYDKTNRAMTNLLRSLTGGKFRSGAIARILARELWTAGEAPTFAEYAQAWSKANEDGLGVDRGLHPEAAWLTDRAKNEAGKDWKAKRERKAKGVLKTLGAIRLE